MNKKSILTILLILGILTAYFLQMAPSPYLSILRIDLGVGDNDALLNLAVSAIYPPLIAASLLGGLLEQRWGLRNLFGVTLGLFACGMWLNYIADSFVLFILGRILFGLGFGLSIPFIGSAIMHFYTPKQRGALNTLNGLFPFLGSFLCFMLMIPLYRLFGQSWQNSLGIWGFFFAVILLLWYGLLRHRDLQQMDTLSAANTASTAKEKGIYRNLLTRREILLLTIIFMCDFFVYSYIIVLLPTFLMESGGFTEAVAGLWAAIAFPAMGMAGCLLGGWYTTAMGRRKPVLLAGVAMEVLGVLLVGMLSPLSIVWAVLGFGLFGLGNGLWLPALYSIPMELPGMTPVLTGGAFALMTSAAMACGFLSPSIGGWITNLLAQTAPYSNAVACHAYGLRISLFLFGFINLLGLLCAGMLRETGPGKQQSSKA